MAQSMISVISKCLLACRCAYNRTGTIIDAAEFKESTCQCFIVCKYSQWHSVDDLSNLPLSILRS